MSMTSIHSSSPIPDVFPVEERQAVYRAIYARRDVRHFRSDPIPDDALAQTEIRHRYHVGRDS